jgi:hypothetical protein
MISHSNHLKSFQGHLFKSFLAGSFVKTFVVGKRGGFLGTRRLDLIHRGFDRKGFVYLEFTQKGLI